MIFKQGVLKEEKIKFSLLIICVLIPYLIIVLNTIYHDNIKLLITFSLIFFLPLFLLILFFGLINLEWFCIYNDRIEAKSIFGTKNVVYYNKVLLVEEMNINLTNRGMEKAFYIFNDGRKNNNNFLGVNSCYNKKRFNLRIYKTPELEKFIIGNIKLKFQK